MCEPVPEPATAGTVHHKPSSAKKISQTHHAGILAFGMTKQMASSFKSQRLSPDEKLRSVLIGGDGYVMIIVEEIPMPAGNLKKVALDERKNCDRRRKNHRRETRTVNGKQILFIK